MTPNFFQQFNSDCYLFIIYSKYKDKLQYEIKWIVYFNKYTLITESSMHFINRIANFNPL